MRVTKRIQQFFMVEREVEVEVPDDASPEEVNQAAIAEASKDPAVVTGPWDVTEAGEYDPVED